MKLIYLLLCINVLFANNSNNVVKTSELELFLFKVGFESLLTDVKSTKDKTSVNGEDIKDLKSKIETIMNEIYKNKRVLTIQDSKVSNSNTIGLNDLKVLKEEIESLKLQVANLTSEQKLKTVESPKVKIEEKIKMIEKITKKKKEKKNLPPVKWIRKDISEEHSLTDNMVRVKSPNARIFSKDLFDRRYLVRRIEVGAYVNIVSCNSFEWCKIKNTDWFIPEFYLD